MMRFFSHSGELSGNGVIDKTQEYVKGHIVLLTLGWPFDDQVDDAIFVLVNEKHRDVVVGGIKHFSYVHVNCLLNLDYRDKNSARIESSTKLPILALKILLAKRPDYALGVSIKCGKELAISRISFLAITMFFTSDHTPFT